MDQDQPAAPLSPSPHSSGKGNHPPLSPPIPRSPSAKGKTLASCRGAASSPLPRPLPLSTEMQRPFRRAIYTAVAEAHIGPRQHPSTNSIPPWAMVYHATLVRSPAQRAWFLPTAAPCPSPLLVPADLVDPRPRPDLGGDTKLAYLGGVARATSGNGLLLLDLKNGRAANLVGGKDKDYAARARRFAGVDSGIARVVCNPLSGEVFHLPDIKKAASSQPLGLLTRSERPHGPHDRYAVAEIAEEDHDGEERSFVMRRFLSRTGEWEELVGLPSPLPLARRLNVHEVLDFGGRLWWVDLSWGAVSADPFSDRPDLRFVELPTGSVMEPMGVQGRFRRMGISEGKLRYVEVSKKEPFFLSSFSLNDDGSSWKLEHHVDLHHCWKNHGKTSEESAPRIGAVDPMNASAIHVTTGDLAFAVDLNKEKVFGFSVLGEGEGYSSLFSGFLSCVLPPWLGSSRIPTSEMN